MGVTKFSDWDLKMMNVDVGTTCVGEKADFGLGVKFEVVLDARE